MAYFLQLAWKSAWNRRLTLGLMLFVISLSVCLLLAVERLRNDAREGFSHAVSGTDLVVGARTSPVQLMLYAVFRIGEATNNISWQSYLDLQKKPAVAWAVPLSLGDSHRGFSVVGTTADYFTRFHYGDGEALQLARGQFFGDGPDHLFAAVIGADVADSLGYQINTKITLSHGTGDVALAEHADKPFRVTGILARTGTPVDRSVHISLQSMQAIHLDWQGGAPVPGFSIAAEYARKFDLQPKEITAVLLGLHNRSTVFRLQRQINSNGADSLLAVLPGVALDQLWQVISIIERVLLAMSSLLVVLGSAGLLAVMLASLNERRRELAILRSAGAGPGHLFFMLMAESLGLTIAGAISGLLLLDLLTLAGKNWIQMHYGILIKASLINTTEIPLLGLVVLTGMLASLVPAWLAYRNSLADGLTPRL